MKKWSPRLRLVFFSSSFRQMAESGREFIEQGFNFENCRR